jgi:hypothetical protein
MTRILAINVVVVLIASTAAYMNPLLYTQGHDPCFSEDTPNATICYPTRCYHLFNISINGTDPVPQSGYPQTYTKFQCVVESYAQYSGYAARKCLKPMCYCNPGYNSLNKNGCSPLKLADCWNQTCV